MSGIDLGNRVVVVTGASQGLGMTMALGLAEAGARVVLASPDRQNLEKVAARIGQQHALAVVADISQAEDCRRILNEAIEKFGDLHVLVNNARRIIDHKNCPIWEADPHFWQGSIMVNVFGTFLMTRTVLPHMMRQGWGRIVNITTSFDTMQRKNLAPYGVTKAAIEAETIIWAKDLSGTGVTVNSLIPGGACTREGRSGPTTRGDTLLQPEVMVPPILWLSSELSDGCSGGRYVGRLWDTSLPPSQAAAKSIEPSVFRSPSQDYLNRTS